MLDVLQSIAYEAHGLVFWHTLEDWMQIFLMVLAVIVTDYFIPLWNQPIYIAHIPPEELEYQLHEEHHKPSDERFEAVFDSLE